MDIGSRLRELRERIGLSQRELARRAGITNASISMIERGQISPSVGSLKQIVEHLGVSLSLFFAPEEEVRDKVFYKSSELLSLSEGGLTFRQVGTRLEGRQLQVMHETYAPGADTGKKMLRHESEEAGIVISGQIEVTVGDQKRLLSAGDGYYFDSRSPHRFRNRGKTPCEIVSACTPPSF